MARGKKNPCGAYVHGPSPSNMWWNAMPTFNDECEDEGGVPDHSGLGTYQNKGFCCDFFGRIGTAAPWQEYYDYEIGQLIFATKGKCVGCPMQAWSAHESIPGSGCLPPTKNEPCRHCVGVRNDWKNKWSFCYFSTNINVGCTNPDSYGLITQDVVNNATSTNIGNANGACPQNCMQLLESYYSNFAVYGNASIPAEVSALGFDNKNQYDCETVVDGEANSGPKLIYAGGWWNGSHNIPSSAYKGSAGKINIAYPSGRNLDKLVNGGFKGYLHTGWNVGNAFGRISSAQQNTVSTMWRRKSLYTLDNSTTDREGADLCCGYVSFGCTDPNFGSYDPLALMNCDGKLRTNKYVYDSLGNQTCYEYADPPVDPNAPGGATNHLDTADDFCYEGNLDCSVCLNSNNEYIPQPSTVTNHLDNYGNATVCTNNIWLACGGSGEISLSAWNQMTNQKPSSSLYGTGNFWDKSARRQGGTWPSNERPLCSCTNEGCMNPAADNYSSLNTKDCLGEPITTLLPFGNETCCYSQQYGCSVSTSDNYFCVIDLTGDGIPDNAQWCMDPVTGIPCDQTSCGSTGGVPLSSNGTQFPQNLTVQIIEDGSCDIDITPGCMDDGGTSIGGSWPAPIYPGYSALNFNEDATVHVQTLCEYGLGCIDPQATNFQTLCDGQSFSDVVFNINNPANPDAAPLPLIDVQFVEDNLVPRAQCCDYNLPGSGSGCTDPSALNFNPLAIFDDGSCFYSEEGCTDPVALNYNPEATIDDGSCIYSTDFPEEGTNFLDGSEIELCMDPLTKEEVLMNVCQPTEIQSEVFIERGKQSVFEPNQRLGEINTIGGLEIYGYGFYNIKRQI